MTNLPENIDESYVDRDEGDAVHQRHHDVIHAELNDATAKGTIAEQFAATAPRTALYLPGATNTFPSAPDFAAFPTGDQDLRWRGVLPALDAVKVWVAKFSETTSRSVSFETSGAARLRLRWSADGTFDAANTVTATDDVPAVLVGQTVWLRVTFDVDNGASGKTARFYYSTDDVEDSTDVTTWTQTGADVTSAGTTSVFDGTDPVSVGGRSGSAATHPGIRRGQVLNGIGGAVVADLRCDAPVGPRYRDPYGNVWTFNGSTWAWVVI